MPEENDELVQPEADEQDNPPELPDDPAERATLLQTKLAAVEEESRRLKSDNERLEESRKELDTAKQTYYRLYEEEKSRNTQPKEQPKDKDDFWYTKDGQAKELADFVAEGVSVQQLFKRAGVVTQAELEKQLDARVARETAKGATLRQLVEAYPEMNDQTSPLMQAAADEFTKLDTNLDDATRWELAAARAARKINYAPKKPDVEDKERTRRVNGQGGPKGLSTSSKPVLTITPEMRREAKRMNGGMEVPDNVLMDTLKRQNADRQAQRA
jgi:hypothetical protein